MQQRRSSGQQLQQRELTGRQRTFPSARLLSGVGQPLQLLAQRGLGARQQVGS
jgi:hypothetical protein